MVPGFQEILVIKIILSKTVNVYAKHNRINIEILLKYAISAQDTTQDKAKQMDLRALMPHISTMIPYAYEKIKNAEYEKVISEILTSATQTAQPNSQEKNIVDMKQVESIISNILAGKSGQMAYPEQKGLPLLFGRKEEQQRREQLGEAIHNFNESLKKVKANSEELKQYSGSILSKETLEQASSKEQETTQNIKQMTQQINHKWQDQKIDENEIKQAENDLGKMQGVKGKILKRKHQIQELAKENMSIGDEKLEDVSHLKGEEKHKARAANKAKGKDKLAEKENIAKSGKDALSAARTKKLEDLKYQR